MTLRKRTLVLFVAAALAPLASQAQYAYPPAAPAPAQVPQRTFTQAELDQMLAPVALYPDPLLSQVLMAATYPIEVVEAARWTRANPGLQGDAAVRAVEGQDWDPSVKSLVAFPEILQRMNEQLNWTESLGDAFLAQEASVMDTVQQLRRRAQAQGNLQSGEQIRVEQQGPTILIEPASPEYVYVPYYDPLVVYGTWWWPAYRPVAWAPWPGYERPYRRGPSLGFWWGRPVGLSVNFFFGGFDWRQRHVRIANTNNFYYRQPAYANRAFVADGGRWQHWQHDPAHRRGMRFAPEVRQRFANAQVERRADRQPAQFQAQPAAQSPFERREERQAAWVQTQPPARPQPQVRQEQRAQPQARQEHRHEQRASMPAAQAPQQPRAERQERREERRDHRQEHGQKS